jgi:mannosyltransferase OCH1-like enzyme
MDLGSLITLFICILVIFLYIRTQYLCRIYELFDDLIEEKKVPNKIIRTVDAPVSNIPADVYMSWKSHMVPPKIYEVIMENVQKNPEFNFHIYSDEECRKYIADNYNADVLWAFDTLKPGAYKSDLWRCCILYKNGGIYIDIKFRAFNPLREFLEKNETVFVKNFYGNLIYQGILIAKPQEPIFLEAIEQIVKNCKEKYYGSNPFETTGPGLIQHIIDEKGLQHMVKLHNILNKSDINNDRIDIYYINDKEHKKLLFQEYNEYRNDMEKIKDKQPHYSKLWNARDIFEDILLPNSSSSSSVAAEHTK